MGCGKVQGIRHSESQVEPAHKPLSQCDIGSFRGHAHCIPLKPEVENCENARTLGGINFTTLNAN
jgi:hypothetical protein